MEGIATLGLLLCVIGFLCNWFYTVHIKKEQENETENE